MAAPTFVSATVSSVAFNATGTSKTASVTWLTGDVIVVMSGSESGSNQPGLPTLTGAGTFVNQKITPVDSTICSGRVDAVVATGGGTAQNVSVSYPNTSDHWGFVVTIWRNSQGIGNSVEQHTTTKTVNLTPLAVDAAVVWCAFDFNAGGAGTATPTPTANDVTPFDDGTRWSYLVARLNQQTSASATAYGQSGGGATGPFTLVAIEIRAASAAFLAAPNKLPRQAVPRAASY